MVSTALKEKTNKHISKLTPPTALKEEGCKEIAEAVNPLVADLFALYVKTKSFHWHLYGPNFRDYHLLLDEQAEQIFNMIDVLAERVRKLGKTTICSINHIANLQNIQDCNDAVLEPEEMLQQLLKDNELLNHELRSAHEVCEKHKDCATTSLLEVYIDETERRIWFLFEILQRG